MTFKSCFCLILLALIIQSCDDDVDSTDKDSSKSLTNMTGVYVSEGYSTRDNGTDWMAVTVIPINQSQAQVNIRARVDNGKTPSCTYSSTTSLADVDVLMGAFPENTILFTFKKNQLSISGATESDLTFLHSFCSEDKTIAGSYTKLSKPLDDAQLLEGGFLKALTMNEISFKIQASSAGSSNSLTIQPSGLSESNNKLVTVIKGFITDAQVADLSGDGFPELLLFIDLGKSKKTGTVVAYSTKEGKVMSPIEYPNTFELEEVGEGYMGQDKFDLKDNRLVQEFPIYTPGGKLTPKTRQVIYKLIHGKNGQFFEVDKVSDN